eukprot:6188746-Pleurochrysis_carterae.AAC.1
MSIQADAIQTVVLRPKQVAAARAPPHFRARAVGAASPQPLFECCFLLFPPQKGSRRSIPVQSSSASRRMALTCSVPLFSVASLFAFLPRSPRCHYLQPSDPRLPSPMPLAVPNLARPAVLGSASLCPSRPSSAGAKHPVTPPRRTRTCRLRRRRWAPRWPPAWPRASGSRSSRSSTSTRRGRRSHRSLARPRATSGSGSGGTPSSARSISRDGPPPPRREALAAIVCTELYTAAADKVDDE